MEEEFYSTIKLISGEELIAKVCYMPDEESLLLENPMIVEVIKSKTKQQDAFVLKEWVKSSYDSMYVISLKQVITMSELDKKIETFYLKNVSGEIFVEDSLNVKPKQMNDRMGYLGSVNETKKYLEEIFNKS